MTGEREAELLRIIAGLRDRTACAERSLSRAGYTHTEGANEWKPPLGPSALPLLAKIDRLELELKHAALYMPARRGTPLPPPVAIGPCAWGKWGMIVETDEEFAERAGTQAAGVTE